MSGDKGGDRLEVIGERDFRRYGNSHRRVITETTDVHSMSWWKCRFINQHAPKTRVAETRKCDPMSTRNAPQRNSGSSDVFHSQGEIEIPAPTSSSVGYY